MVQYLVGLAVFYVLETQRQLKCTWLVAETSLEGRASKRTIHPGGEGATRKLPARWLDCWEHGYQRRPIRLRVDGLCLSLSSVMLMPRLEPSETEAFRVCSIA